MKGYVAVQRKLLALIYTIYKTDKEYNPNFETEKKEKMEQSKKENIQNSVTDFLYYQIDNAIKSL